MNTLEGKIALVAGATRGAGRAIARTLAEHGATVYCTGRSTRGHGAMGGRPETLEETAELITAAGGKAIAVRADHTVEADVVAVCDRIREEQGRLDILINDVWGGDELIDFGKKFWELSMDKARALLERAVFTHIQTSRYAVPLMFQAERGLIVEVTDGDTFGYRGNFTYDLTKMSVIRLAFNMAQELRKTKITALSVTPGFLRSEFMLDLFGVTEANWRDAVSKEPHFIASETPFYVARAIAALAADPDVRRKAGRVFSSWDLAKEYGFTDVDGNRPDWGAYFTKTFNHPYPVADERAFESWRISPFDLAAPDHMKPI